MRAAIAAGLIAALCQPVLAADDGAALARNGRRMWAAFTCGVLSDDDAEVARLFAYGHAQGQIFLKALRSNQMSKADIDGNVPVGVLWRLQGPNDEFIIGRIYQAALEDTSEKIYKAVPELGADEARKLHKGNEFRSQNCELLGKD